MCSKSGVRLEAEDYLRFGTKLVWLVFPEERRVEVYEPAQDVLELGVDDMLDGGDVLPGFSLRVSEVFPA